MERKIKEKEIKYKTTRRKKTIKDAIQGILKSFPEIEIV